MSSTDPHSELRSVIFGRALEDSKRAPVYIDWKPHVAEAMLTPTDADLKQDLDEDSGEDTDPWGPQTRLFLQTNHQLKTTGDKLRRRRIKHAMLRLRRKRGLVGAEFKLLREKFQLHQEKRRALFKRARDIVLTESGCSELCTIGPDGTMRGVYGPSHKPGQKYNDHGIPQWNEISLNGRALELYEKSMHTWEQMGLGEWKKNPLFAKPEI